MSRRRSYRRIVLGASALLCVAGLVVTIGWFRLSGSALPTRGSVRVPGLHQTVVVQVDTFGIPSVNAGAETDMLRALGYLHATDRMWQMEFFRRVAAGRLAEVFGRDLVGTDRLLRTLDLWGAAERAAQGLDLDERERLLAYSAGVNARLDDVRKPLAPEFSLLRFKPEPWDPVSVMAVGMVMNLDLSHWRRDLSRYWASPTHGARQGGRPVAALSRVGRDDPAGAGAAAGRGADLSSSASGGPPAGPGTRPGDAPGSPRSGTRGPS